jgi:hypothetical protein
MRALEVVVLQPRIQIVLQCIDAASDVPQRYAAFCDHYGMLASRNNPGEAHENGAVEAHNNHLKVALDQALILRGSRDFPGLAAWRGFVDELVGRRNRRREAAVQIEMKTLRSLPTRRTTQGLRMKFSRDDLGHILVVPGGLFASGLEGYLGI